MRKIVFLLIIVVSLCKCEKDNNRLANWTKVYEGLFYFSSVCFPNSDTGYVIGGSRRYSDHAVVIKTIDGGTTWSASLDNSSYGRLYSVCFTDAKTGYAVGRDGNLDSFHGIIYKTSDGGITWTIIWRPLDPIEDSSLQSVYFVDSNMGYAVGSNLCLKTINGGMTWSNLDVPEELGGLESVYFTNSTTGYIVTSNCIILKTCTGGK